jgi:arabinofuranosyltransferase
VLWLRVRPSPRRTIGLVGIAAALPVGYEIFRAGYYGMLVPMPAISKAAGRTDWQRGIAYLRDFAGPYHLYIAVLLLAVAAIIVPKRLSRIDQAVIVPVGAAVITGLAMIGYVIAIGGDFMHGRMLLPGVFLLLLPVSLLPWSRGVVVLCCALGARTVLCASSWRPAYSAHLVSTSGIADERRFWGLMRRGYKSRTTRRTTSAVPCRWAGWTKDRSGRSIPA